MWYHIVLASGGFLTHRDAATPEAACALQLQQMQDNGTLKVAQQLGWLPLAAVPSVTQQPRLWTSRDRARDYRDRYLGKAAAGAVIRRYPAGDHGGEKAYMLRQDGLVLSETGEWIAGCAIGTPCW